MKIVDPYTAICFQTAPKLCTTRSEVAENIKSITAQLDSLIYGKDPFIFPGQPEEDQYAPVKLIAIPEFGLAGWGLDIQWKYLENKVAIEIPGPEIDIIAEKAKQLGIWIGAGAIAHDPEWLDVTFNTYFIISPEGKVIYQRRKVHESIMMSSSISPHDIYDEYVKKYGPGLDTFYPVVRTPIGNLGAIICYEGLFPESYRAIAMNGAEVVMHPNFMEPYYSQPLNTYEILNRAAAINNLIYVLGNALGGLPTALPGKKGYEYPQYPELICPGDAMVIDYNGAILGRTKYPGWAFAVGVIRINHLRKRRADYGVNPLIQLRTECFREIYEKSIYPPNLWRKRPWKTEKDLINRANPETLKEFYKRKIYEKPE